MLKQHAGKGEDLSMNKAKIAVLVSGGGTNLQALLDAQAAGTLAHGEITLVVSSNEGAYALTRAANAGIRAQTISPKQCGGQAAFEAALSALLAECEIDLIVLAGFLTILSADFTARWPSRILNVHLPDPRVLWQGDVRSESPRSGTSNGREGHGRDGAFCQ